MTEKVMITINWFTGPGDPFVVLKVSSLLSCIDEACEKENENSKIIIQSEDHKK